METRKKPEGIESRSYQLPIEVEARAEGNSRRVIGTAVRFGELSSMINGWFREKFQAGAFNDTMNQDTVAVFNHDDNKILARTISKTLTLTVDDQSLRYEFEAPNTTAGNDLLESLKRGDVQHSSFRFVVDQDVWNEDPDLGLVRTVIRARRLVDVSPVVFPAYPQTDVAQRSYDEFKNTESKPDYKIFENQRSIKLKLISLDL